MGATIYLLILIAAFIGIVVWVFGRKRKARFAKDAGSLSTMGRIEQRGFRPNEGCHRQILTEIALIL